MAIIAFDPDEIIEYIPISERGKKDPCVIHMKYVPFGQVQKYSQMISRLNAERTRSLNDDREILEITGVTGREIQRQQFCDSVVKIENFSVKGKHVFHMPVTDPGEFYDKYGDAGLITEIIRAMESAARLSEGQRKNFSAPSATA